MFRSQLAVLVLVGTMLGGVHTAAAFSTEQAGDAFKGNASNFSDPDEQAPAYLSSPDSQSSRPNQSQPSVVIDQNAMREHALGLSDAFDRAYSAK